MMRTMQTQWLPASTNNYERGRGAEKIEYIILHWSNSEPLTTIDTKFVDANRLASTHYAIHNTQVHQYVKDEDTAFHAGSAVVDKKSLSIICVGGVNMPITEATYQTVALLIEELARKYRIRIDADHIKGHNSVAQGRCPGTLDLARIITDAKKLSPQSIIERLHTEKETLAGELQTITKKHDTFEARVEELRRVIREKDTEIITKSEDLVYVSIKCAETEVECERLVGDTLALAKEVTALQGDIAELQAVLSRPIFVIILKRLREALQKFVWIFHK